MTQSAGPRRLVLWFRNDLRLLDNYIVHEAVQKIKANEYDDVSEDSYSAKKS
jgi:deoxyribodipyrimidine photo-lyase